MPHLLSSFVAASASLLAQVMEYLAEPEFLAQDGRVVSSSFCSCPLGRLHAFFQENEQKRLQESAEWKEISANEYKFKSCTTLIYEDSITLSKS